MKLSKRLMTCAQMVRRGVRVCDVGTDHGKLACYLVGEGMVRQAIATELNAQPLLRAAETVRRCGLEGKVALVQTDGLRGIDETAVDDVVIAGMGGQLIGKILGECPWREDRAKRYLLQPMTQTSWLRRFLCEMGFAIEAECAVEGGGHYYTVMRAKFAGETRMLSKYDALVGGLPQTVAAVEELARAEGFVAREVAAETVGYLGHQVERLRKIVAGQERAQDGSGDTGATRRLAERLEDTRAALMPLVTATPGGARPAGDA